MRRLTILLLPVVLLACSGPGPVRPMENAWEAETRTLPGGLAAHGVGTRWRCDLLGATAGPLAGYLAARNPSGDADPELFRRANREPDLVEAARLFDELLEADPEDAAARNNRALLALALGERDEAERGLRESLARGRNYRPARDNLDRYFTDSR